MAELFHTVFLPYFRITAGVASFTDLSGASMSTTPRIDMAVGPYSYTAEIRAEEGIALQIVPAMKVHAATIVPEFGDTNSRWRA